jgi:DNA-binding CsgD family transcriptional regulator
VIRHSPLQLEDLSACVEIIAAHPVLGPRYGPSLERLKSAWSHLLHSDAFFSLAIKETGPGWSKALSAQVACFVTNEFADEIATRPLRWMGPELANRTQSGPPVILTDSEVRLANSTDGLNLFVWPTCFPPEHETNAELRQTCQALFFDLFRGFNVKRMQTQLIHPVELRMAVNSGARYLLGADPNYSQDLGKAALVVMQPHVVEATRAMALQQPGTWINQFFAYRRPKIGLSRSEQRLLAAALQGGTDEELAKLLAISLSAVKKMWASVYLRVETARPSDLKFAPNENADGDRGREKKHKLLAYLRAHPEELRPYSIKLLNQPAS